METETRTETSTKETCFTFDIFPVNACKCFKKKKNVLAQADKTKNVKNVSPIKQKSEIADRGLLFLLAIKEHHLVPV